MKILYAIDPRPDYGSSMIWSGLVASIGYENVTDIPYQFQFHTPSFNYLLNPFMERFKTEHPRLWVEYGFNLHGEAQYMMETRMYPEQVGKLVPPYVPEDIIGDPSSVREYVRELDNKTLSEVKDFDVLFVSSRVFGLWMAKIVKEINPNIPVVIVDCDDHSGIDYFSAVHYEEEGFFKLENVIAVIKFQRFDSTHLPDGLDHNVHLPSLTDPRVIGVCYPSIVLDNYEKREELDDSWENKEYDIQCRLGLNRFLRTIAYKEMDKLKNRNIRVAADYKWLMDSSVLDKFIGKLESPRTKPEYYHLKEEWNNYDTGKKILDVNYLSIDDFYRELAHSKMSINMSGWSDGWNMSFRYTEIPSFNTMMLTNKPLTMFDYPFLDGEHCIFINNSPPYDIADKVKYFMKNDNECREIAKNGHEHGKKYYNLKSWGLRILEKIEERL